MSNSVKLNIIERSNIPVSMLLQSPTQLVVKSGEVGLNNMLNDKNLHRPQLALAGYVGLFTFNRPQVFGNTECYYIKSLSIEERLESFKRICQFPIPCIILTHGNSLEEQLLDIAIQAGIAVFETKIETTKAYSLLSEFLDDQFSLQATIHGSFVDVYGVGILFTGRSAIGKSEIALDLIERGHRLVADDVVMLTKKRESIIMGTGTNLVQHFMEIRGLGIIDIRQMFGIRSIRFQKRVEIIVELEVWEAKNDYTRTGLDDTNSDVLGVPINTVKLPIFPGKNITVIAEVIALNYLLKTYGYSAADVFAEKLRSTIEIKSKKNRNFFEDRIISHFQGDNE